MIHVQFQSFNAKKTLEIARAQEIELSKHHPLDIGGVKRLAMIDNYLAHFYLRDGKQDEARSLIEESISHCEAYLARQSRRRGSSTSLLRIGHLDGEQFGWLRERPAL